MRLKTRPHLTPSSARARLYAMVVIRPVTGVRNPVRSTSSHSFLRAKNTGRAMPGFNGNDHGTTNPVSLHQRVSPVQAAGGGATNPE